MRIKLHDDVEGHKSGESVDVVKDRAEWLIREGYASSDTVDVEKVKYKIKGDPTLGENAEDPGPGLAEQMDAGLGKGSGDEPDEFPDTEPVELTNGKGDPEKAAAGKERLEEDAESTDSEKAPEEQAKA